MAVQYTVPQFEAAVGVAENCQHNKLDHMACVQCFAQHLAEIGAGAKPDAQFMEEYRQVYEEVVKLRAAEDKHAEEMIVIAEALSEARAAAHVESEYATKARTHIDTLDAIKAERDKAKKRHRLITNKYREVRDTLRDTLDALKIEREVVAAAEETIEKLTNLATGYEKRIAGLQTELSEAVKQIVARTKDRDEWAHVSDMMQSNLNLWGAGAIALAYMPAEGRKDMFGAAIQGMVHGQMVSMEIDKTAARKYVADWLRICRKRVKRPGQSGRP